MRKTFLAKRNTLLSVESLSWGALVLVCAIAALVLRLCAPNIFWILLSPAFRASDALATAQHTFIASFSDAAMLAKSNELLRNENSALVSENKTLLAKVLALSHITDTPQASGTGKGIIAGVMARPPVSPYDTLVVAGGLNAGVKSGMEVLGAGGVPLGIVGSLSADFSQVILFSSSGMNTAAWVGPDAAPLNLIGAGGGAFTATIARSANIVEGDTVFVPGPGLLPIGMVVRVDSDPSSPSVALRIQPLLNPFSITVVEMRATGDTAFTTLRTATSTLP